MGYRVKSQIGTRFRQWANGVLKQYLLQGYSVNRQLVALQERVDTRFNAIEPLPQRPRRQDVSLEFILSVEPVLSEFILRVLEGKGRTLMGKSPDDVLAEVQ